MKTIRLASPAWLRVLMERFEFLRLLVQNLTLLGVVFCGVLVLTTVAYLVMPVRYVATGTVLVGDPEPAFEQTPGDTMKVGDPADMESQLLIARSQSVMRRALKSAKAQAALREECLAEGGKGFDGDCDKLLNRMDKLVEYTSSRYSIGSVGRSRIINIAYTSSQPKVAEDMANALIGAFLEEQKETASGGRTSAANWLKEEAARLDNEIRALDKQIVDYRAKNGLVRGSSAPVNSERLTAISQQLAVAQAAQANANARLREINDGGLGGSANATAVLESRTVGDLKQRITEVDGQLANAETSLGPAHPRRKALSDELRALNGRLANEISRITQNAQKQSDAATDRVALLTRQLETAKAEVSSATEGEFNIEDVVRNVEIKRQQYADLVGRANRLEVDRLVRSGNVRLVSEAKEPLKPFFPKKVPFAAAGVMLGLILGAVAAVTAGNLSAGVVAQAIPGTPAPTGNTPESQPPTTPNRVVPAQRTRRTPMTFSVAIPHVRTLSGKGASRQASRTVIDTLMLDPDARDAMDEFAAVFATGQRGGHPGSVLLVTSPSIGSGKTVTTVSLARYLAAKGKKTLVVESNVDRPLVADILDVSVRPVRMANIPHDPVVKSAFVRLDVVPLGYARQIMPRDQQSERRLADLLAWARKQYDVILLDGPSATESADVWHLLHHVDAAVVCARQEELVSEATAAVIADVADLQQVGVVVTMASLLRDTKTQPERRVEMRSRR